MPSVSVGGGDNGHGHTHIFQWPAGHRMAKQLALGGRREVTDSGVFCLKSVTTVLMRTKKNINESLEKIVRNHFSERLVAFTP